MNYLTADAEIRRMAQGLRDYSDDKLGALSRHGSGLGIDAANYEMFRRIACKVPPTREPMPIEQVLDLQAAAARAAKEEQLMLYAVKQDMDPDDDEARAVIRSMRKAVKAHNKKLAAAK